MIDFTKSYEVIKVDILHSISQLLIMCWQVKIYNCTCIYKHTVSLMSHLGDSVQRRSVH